MTDVEVIEVDVVLVKVVCACVELIVNVLSVVNSAVTVRVMLEKVVVKVVVRTVAVLLIVFVDTVVVVLGVVEIVTSGARLENA